MKKAICELLDISDVSYYRWKKDRLIISFLEKYFTQDDIREYIETKKMKKLELIKDHEYSDLKDCIDIELINVVQINGKFNNFDIGSLIALYILLKNTKNPLISLNKKDFITLISNEMKWVKIDWEEDLFYTKFNQINLLNNLELFLNDSEISFICKNTKEILTQLEQIIELKRGFLSKLFPKPKDLSFSKLKIFNSDK